MGEDRVWRNDYSNALVELGVKAPPAVKEKRAQKEVSRTRIPGTNVYVPDAVVRISITIGVGCILYLNWLITNWINISDGMDWSIGMLIFMNIPFLIVTVNVGGIALLLAGAILYGLFWKLPRWLIWGIE